MSKSQWVRTLTRLCILTILSVGLWQLSGNAKYLNTQQSSSDQDPILLSTTQLPSVDGIVPVTLKCETQSYAKPTQGKALRCILKNNTSNPITAVSLAYSVEYEANGRKSTDTGSVTMDALIHPDFHDANFSKFIAPGNEGDIQSRRLIDDAMSKIKIAVGIDYLEFDKGTALGSDSNGSRLIKQIREGAARYKEWLKRNYLEQGKSMDAVKILLDRKSSVATDLELPAELEVGADEYRRNARQVIKFQGGSSELEKHLISDPSPNNHKP